MTRATLTTPFGREIVVLLSDPVDEIEMGSSPSFIEESTNNLIQCNRVIKIVATISKATFWTSEGEHTLELI